MSTTSNPYKNTYGKKRRKMKLNRQDQKMLKIAKMAIKQSEVQDTELKLFDKEIVPGTNVTSAGFITVLSNTIATGVTNKTRVGHQINMKSLLVRYNLTIGDTTNIIRCIVFRWNAPSSPSVTDILELIPSSSIVWPLSPLKYEERMNIQVLYDQLHALSADNGSHVEKLYIKKDLKINWDDSANPINGHVYFLAISDSTSSFHPTIGLASRLRFIDP